MCREFERASCVVLPNFLDSALLAVVQEQVACGLFSAVDHEGFGRDFPMRDNHTSQVLNFLFNDPRFLSAIRTLTGCRAIRSFGGSVRRAIAGAGNSLSWHSDAFRGRWVAIPADTVWRRIGDGMVVVKASDGLCYRLDPVGSRIWELAAKRVMPHTIVTRIAKEYSAPRKTIERDVIALLTELAANHLVTVEPSAAARQYRVERSIA